MNQPQNKQIFASLNILQLVYAGYIWILLILIGIPVWPLVSYLPNYRWSWAVLRRACLILTRLSATSFRVTGSVASIDTPYVVVANHASFIDALVLILTLRRPVAFIAGGELATQRLAGPVLRGLACEFVLPESELNGTSNITRYAELLRCGRNLVIFPEGSLGKQPGVRRFHLGAFVIAAKAGAAIVPIGIQGSRDVVRPGSHLPRRSSVIAAIGDPIWPSGTGSKAAISLRNEAHAAIVQLCKEPSLVR